MRHMSPALTSARESQENILGMEEGAHNGIVKTTDIRLSYENGSEHRDVPPLEYEGYITPTERI